MATDQKPPLLGVGHLPLYFVRQFIISDDELRGVKEGFDLKRPYVCVVRFDIKSRPDHPSWK